MEALFPQVRPRYTVHMGEHVPATLEERQPFVEIRDRRGGEVVAILELLSPSNKNSGRDRQQYLGKRDQILDSPTHFLEIDLLRGGPRLPVEGLPPCAYYALVSRTERRPDVDLWPWSLREAMPAIPVPLSAGDPDARLDLQALLHRVYDTSSYADYIYLGAPQPALASEDVVWARTFVPTVP